MEQLPTQQYGLDVKNIESQVASTFNRIEQNQAIDKITYDLSISGFPFIKAEFKNLNIHTTKPFRTSKDGYLFSAFKENTLTYKTKNIFSPQVAINNENTVFDFYSTDISANDTVKAYTFIDAFKMNISATETLFDFKNISIQATTKNLPLITIFDITKAKFKYDYKSENYHTIISLEDVKTQNRRTGELETAVKNVDIDVAVDNFPTQQFNEMLKKRSGLETKAEQEKVILDIIDVMRKKKTKLNINKLDVNTSFANIKSNIEAFVSGEFIFVNGKIAVKFSTPNSLPETLLAANGVQADENGTFNIELKVNEKGGFINDKITFPPLIVRPVHPENKNPKTLEK